MNEKILIVEDDNIVRLHLRTIVQDLGYHVCGAASTASEALRSAVATAPDVVLMDINLSGNGDGIDVARELRAQNDAAVVFLTAYADEETVTRAQAVGALGYLVKPISKSQLRASLSTALGEQRRRRRAHQGERALASSQGARPDAILVTDERGLICFINPVAAELVGCRQDQALDRDVVDVLRSRWRLERAAGTAPIGDFADLSNAKLVDENGNRLEAHVESLKDTDGTGHGSILVLKNAVERARPAHPGVATRKPFGAGTRMAMFSHDTLGLGHLQRSLNISRALVERFPSLSILLITGSPAVHRYALPKGVDYIKLPAVRKTGAERYEARSLGLSDEGILRFRSNIVLRSLEDYDPHVLLVDHAPLGMKGELQPALEWLRDHRPACIKMIGLRDVIDDPQTVVASWQRHGIYDALRDLYQHILIYGQPDVFDAAAAYQFPPELVAKSAYCNYVGEFEVESLDAQARLDGSKPCVVLTVGGGDGGETLIGAYLEMLRGLPRPIAHESVVLTGPFLDSSALALFREQSNGLPVRWVDFVPTTSPYLEHADLVICTGGYNTVTQTLRFAKRAIVVPRVMHRAEQLIRARRLDELGWITMLPPGELTAESLGRCVRSALSSPSEPLTEARAAGRMRFDGAARVAEFCGQLTVTDNAPI